MLDENVLVPFAIEDDLLEAHLFCLIGLCNAIFENADDEITVGLNLPNKSVQLSPVEGAFDNAVG